MKHILHSIILLFFFHVVNGQNNGIGDTIHAVHYSIHMNEINTSEKSISAVTEITITPLVNELDYIPLELKYLVVDEITVNENPATFSQQAERLVIQLADPISIDDTVVVRVSYQGQPFHESWGGFHFSGDYAFNLGVGFESIPHNLGKTWFPCIDNFTDRASYDLYVTVPDSIEAIGGGLLVNIIDNDNNTQTWHWQLSREIPTYLESVMVGDYVLYEDSFYGVEDTIPITIYTRPQDTGKVAGSFVNLKEILDFFESHFGPYPFGRVGYTGTSIGAMEHATNISYPHSAIDGGLGRESLYTHELAHMWFGDKVTCSTAEDMWLNEGWATFIALYYLRELYGEEDFNTAMREKHKEVLKTTHFTDDGYWSVSDIPQTITYGSTAYDKGSIVANTLRGFLGDSVFFDAMTAYIDHFAWQSISSEQMRDFLSDYTGIDMTGFFDAWVFTEGTPHFSIDSTRILPGDATYFIDIWTSQKYKGADFLAQDMVMPISIMDQFFNIVKDTVHISGKNGHSTKAIHMETMFYPPVAIFMDLDEQINDATIDNYKLFTQAEEYNFPETYFKVIIDELNDSAFIRVTNSWVAPDSLKNPVDGLRLSDYRHWKVEGVFPEDMQASGRFYYDNNMQLDGGLITSNIDSARLLYRSKPADEWMDIPQYHVGIWSVGHIYVDDLKPGEYTLAVWDKQIVGEDESKLKQYVKIFPNPSNGKLQFEFPQKDEYQLSFYHANGILFDSINVNARRKTWRIPNYIDASEIILVKIYKAGKLFATEKIILLP